jgi:hypothetical protein
VIKIEMVSLFFLPLDFLGALWEKIKSGSKSKKVLSRLPPSALRLLFYKKLDEPKKMITVYNRHADVIETGCPEDSDVNEGSMP